MPTRPKPDEFDISDQGITHKPTGYAFAPYPGNPTAVVERKGQLGKILPTGEDYRPEDVKEMAESLWIAHWSFKKHSMPADREQRGSPRFGPEQRRSPRFIIPQPAQISFAGKMHNCTLHDISDTGARLIKTVEVEWPALVTLELFQQPLTRECRVVWQRGREAGVEFTQPLGSSL